MVTKTTRPPDEQGALLTGQGVESLDAIAAEGAGLDVPPAADEKAAAQVLASEAEEIASALQLLRAAALPFAPEHVQDPIGQVWNDRQLIQIARAIVEVCRLHGITVGQLFEGYGPYINLCMAVGIPALATLKLLRVPPPKAPPANDGQHQPA